MLDAHRIPLTQYRGPLDHVPELPDITRPLVTPESIHSFRSETMNQLVVLSAEECEHPLRQLLNVIRPLRERRKCYLDDVKPVVQVFAESSLPHYFLQIGIRSR